MGFFNSSLRNKILFISIAALLFLTCTSLFIIQFFNQNISQYDELFNQSLRNERLVSELQSDFKEQVQEWKNVLIRGHDSSQRNKYWNAFNTKHQQIQQKLTEIERTVKGRNISRILEQFKSSHNALLSKYQSGYNQFGQSNFDHKLADNTVMGIDRVSSSQLKEAIEILRAKITSQSEKVSASTKSATAISIPVLIIMTILLSGILYWLLTQQFKKPFETLMRQVEKLGQGDFSVDFTSKRNDELGTMSQQLCKAQSFLRELLGHIKQSTSKLNKNADTINKTSTEIAHGTQATTSRLEQSATAVTEMTATVQEVARNAVAAATSASDADQSAKLGLNVMQNTIDTINHLSHEVQLASDVIRKLEEDTSSVGTVLDVIRGIAEQTNLLALNAAIEAARAGEQGRGFAVVADEVRNLAQRTQESTAEIQQIILNVQTGAKDAVQAMEQGRESTTACVEQASEAGLSLKSITNAVNEIHKMNTQIATAAEEQTIVSEDISRNVNEITNSTSEIHNSIRQFNTLAGSLAEMAVELNDMTDKIKI